MSGKDLGVDVYKMNRRYHIKSKETKAPNESLRSPRTYPNFWLKSPDLGGRTSGLSNKNFLFCEKTKQFFTSCENGSGDASSHCKSGVANDFNKEEFGSKMSEGTLTGNSVESISGRSSLLLTPSTKEENAVAGPNLIQSSSSDLLHTKQKKIQNSPENILSISYDSKLFNSLMPSPRMTTCHHCGLYGDLRCSQCKQTYYCSTDCQKKDWSAHSIVCKPIKQNLKKSEDNVKLPGEIKNKIDFKGSLSPVDAHKIEDDIKKIMLSDLQNLGLKKAMEIQGTVTEFRNPSEFYIQVYSPEVLEHISKLTVKLKDCYANIVNQEEYIPIEGEVCVAKYSLDQTWNRVLVKKVDILQKKAQVLYIDYGNGENVPLDWIKPLHKDMELFPPCAIKCCVANVVPKQGEWNKDCANIITPLLMGQYCSVTVVDLLQEEMMTCFAVDVVLPGSGKHLDKILLEIGHELSPKRKETKKMNPDTGTMLQKDSEGEREKTAEDEKLVHNSDLAIKVFSVSVGDTFSGVVAHIQTPEDFFCQQMHNGRQLAELQVSLGEYCNKIPTIPNFCPAAGDVCCAQFTEDNQWYRASVLAYTSEDTALVGYIDYGNFEVLQVARLRPMIPKLLELPVQAIKCTLAGVKPPSGAWSLEAISLMKQLVQNKMITIRVVDKKENSSVVEIADESVTPIINVSKHLLESGYAVKDSKDVLTINETVNTVKEVSAVGEAINKMDCTWVKLTLKQILNVMLCTVNNPGDFFCQIFKDDDLLALNVLNKSLAEYCQQISTSVFKPSKGEPCCAFFSGDGNWYRALVKKVSSDVAIKVQFVDYGNVETVTPDKLRQISSTFLKLPFQGIRCWLSGVKPVNKEWLPEATARFQMCTAGIKLQARVVAFNRSGAGIELIDNSTGCPRIISEILISEKLALKEGLPNKDGLPNTSAEKIEPQETSSEQWQTVELPVNETVSVRVMEVISPDLFYALPSETRVDQEKLRRLMIELVEYCDTQNSHSFRPKVGEACCAKFAGDGHWYRAIVLGVSQSEVKVAYADYGNTETLPFSRVLPITARYLKLPFQIIKCSLAGIKEWSPLIIDLLKTLILNKCVMITVKGINENIHAVSVEKCFENSSLSIADKLVMEGLAKYSNSGNQSILHQVAHANEASCCCTELKKQIEKHEQILIFLLNKHVAQDKCSEMKKLLQH
ncbi:tudor domain-containing protein 1 isoform X1 [Dermochelys coriacea]|uniref:tudor domain-containing protein 1 isoform X1 n=1 Tax=Dermochelys coriacea TaxID=27794 RepID=UPI001CA84DA8|nr:tudor domain-containing protein 1 isoform X1 [Dermochelys coriacea]XP_043374939.1 tudor domain-containing protein 1 isoform X1 [Dermochelys coriacea]XP_043374941.1 tudor domain-containing protein 1 isoform X1 [Dermochelys coriacea]XP_043374942.1 tudor domain-containing protein 1 isoform X1 [Dermochelys coriacea]